LSLAARRDVTLQRARRRRHPDSGGGSSSCISHLFILRDRSWGGLAQQVAEPVWRQQLMMVSASELSFLLIQQQ